MSQGRLAARNQHAGGSQCVSLAFVLWVVVGVISRSQNRRRVYIVFWHILSNYRSVGYALHFVYFDTPVPLISLPG